MGSWDEGHARHRKILSFENRRAVRYISRIKLGSIFNNDNWLQGICPTSQNSSAQRVSAQRPGYRG